MLYHPDQVSYKPGPFFQRIKGVAIERLWATLLGIPVNSGQSLALIF